MPALDPLPVVPAGPQAAGTPAIAASPDDVAVIATDGDGRVTEWNAGAERLFGWSAEEMQGQAASRCFTPEDCAQDIPERERRCALATGCVAGDRWYLKKDGARFLAQGEMVPLRGAGGAPPGFLTILRDRTAQGQAAAAHRADAEFLRSVLAASADCIKVLDLDGNLIFMSEGGQRVMEVSDFNAIRGCPWPDFWRDESNGHARAAVAAAKAGGSRQFQGPADTMAGSPRWWDVQVTPILGADRRPEKLLSISRDVTASRQAGEALRKSEARWRGIFDRLHEGFILGEMVRDADGRAVDWRYLEVNPAWEGMTGLARETVIGRTVGELLPGVAPQWLDDLDRVVETGKPASFARQLGALGHWYEVHAFRPEPGNFAVLFLDITVRQQVESALRASEAQFRSFAQAMPNHVWTAPPDGQLDWFNDQVYTYSGAARGALDGDGWAAMVQAEDLPDAARRWAAALASGETYETEFRLRRHDGVFRWHIARAVPICGAAGEVTRWIGTNTDIEDQKTAAQALIDLNATLERRVEERTAALMAAEEALRQSQKMEALGQLTGGIAHDFNNLLTGITGSLDLVRRRLDAGRRDGVDRFMDAAVTSAQRAAALTHRLLAFARRQSLDTKPQAINAVVAGLEDMLRRTFGETVACEMALQADLWPALTDANQLESALLNLAINARDAMPDGGRLTIETMNTRLDEAYALQHDDLAAGDYVAIAVSDTGVGMAAAVIAKAFDPFFTTKPVGQGTGLGLSMIYGFAKQSGGHLRLYSEVGQGTTVKLFLRRAPTEAAVRPDEPAAAAPRGRGETVLVVEDDEAVRLLVAEVLAELGYHCLEAAEARTAMAFLQSAQPIDLLVTDVGLPHTNGRQLAEIARQHRPDLKVLFITGYAETAAVRGSFLAPGMEMMTKPFALDALAARIRQLIES